MTEVKVIGAGLAGSECAWQLARRGVKVRLVAPSLISSKNKMYYQKFDLLLLIPLNHLILFLYHAN